MMDEEIIKKHVNSLKELFHQQKGEHHLIVMHDYPDPDAIASAWAHSHLCRAFGVDSTIAYGGEVSHPQNIAMMQLLEIDVVRSDALEALGNYDGYVLVDNQGVNTALFSKLKDSDIPCLAIVDHHAKQETVEALFTDVRSVGSASTIYVQYIQAGLFELNRSNQRHVRLATALMHGIRTDTDCLTRAAPVDYEAAAFLSTIQDPSLLHEITSVKRQKRVMEVIEKALARRRVLDNFALAGVGYLRQQDRDIIPQVADFLLTEEDVHSVIVYGVVRSDEDGESIVGSLRSTKLTINIDQFLKETFGNDSQGQPYGGGRRHAGAFEIPLGFISGVYDDEHANLKWELVDRTVSHKILHKLGQTQ